MRFLIAMFMVLVSGFACVVISGAVLASEGQQEVAKSQGGADDVDVSNLSSIKQRMVIAVNKYRALYNLPPLHPNATLMRVADHRVKVYNHQAYGCWSWDEAHRAGFKGPVTDNLCQGASTPEECVGTPTSGGWGDARPGHTVGHDKQMRGYFKINSREVNMHYDSIGVAKSGSNWIAVFGRDDSK